MSARLLSIYPDVQIHPLGEAQQKQNAVQHVITLILTRAQLAKSPAALAECRKALLEIEVFAAAAGDFVSELQDKHCKEI